MPPLTRWYIKTALAYFVVALLAGLALAVRSVAALPLLFNTLAPVYFHLLMVGWVTQLIFGVGFWILPRFVRGPARGDERWVWAAHVLLNAGVLSVSLGQWLAWPAWIPLLGRAAELLAVVAFALHAWPRIKPHGM